MKITWKSPQPFGAPLHHSWQAQGTICLFPSLPKRPPGILQPWIYVETINLPPYLNLNYLRAFCMLQSHALWFLHPLVPDSPHGSKQGLWKNTRSNRSPGLHYHNSKQQNGVRKGKSITFGECILVSFNINKSLSFNGFRFDLVPTLNKHLHPYAVFKPQKHQFTFFSVSPLSISTSCKSNSSLFIKSTISLWTERQGKENIFLNKIIWFLFP